MSENGQRVVIITGGSQGIGAGLVDGYRQRGWAVVANALTIKPADDPDVATVAGDVSDPATAKAIMDAALDRFGHVDSLVNNAGVFMSKAFTDYTAADYALITGVNVAGFFWLTQLAVGPHRAHQGRARRRHQVARHRVRIARHPGQRGLAWHHPDADAPSGELRLTR
jgi:NAD(P)-dependent dehydrogenase (short-subunit alcohol dehydrogenase family)